MELNSAIAIEWDEEASRVRTREDVSAIRFNMEVLRQQAEEESYLAFVDYAQATLKAAGEYKTTVAGKWSAVGLLRDLIYTLVQLD